MTETGQNLEVYQGKDKLIDAIIYDTAGVELDITSCTFEWVVYRPTSGEIVITMAVGSGITIIDAPNGLLRSTLVPDDTLTLLGNYNHECELTDATSKIDTVFTGYFKVIASKTN